jgi:hypothetical protein
MTDLIQKISSYNLFNYLLPGILFSVALEKFGLVAFDHENLVIEAFVFYFIGLSISRFGSLITEPILKKIKFLKFALYKDFISASKKDPQIEIFSEANNTYRTLTSMIILLILLKAYSEFELLFPMLIAWRLWFLLVLLFIIFLYSYKKQTDYISKRINISKD